MKLLEEFESTGLSSRKSISPFMERNFKKPTSDDPNEWAKENTDAHLFLQDVRHTGHFDFDEEETWDIRPGRWYDEVNIHVRITISGLEYLERHLINVSNARTNGATAVNFLITIILSGVTVYLTRANLMLSENNNNQNEFIVQHWRSTQQRLDTVEYQVLELRQQNRNLKNELRSTEEFYNKHK